MTAFPLISVKVKIQLTVMIKIVEKLMKVMIKLQKVTIMFHSKTKSSLFPHVQQKVEMEKMIS